MKAQVISKRTKRYSNIQRVHSFKFRLKIKTIIGDISTVSKSNGHKQIINGIEQGPVHKIKQIQNGVIKGLMGDNNAIRQVVVGIAQTAGLTEHRNAIIAINMGNIIGDIIDKKAAIVKIIGVRTIAIA
jgi:hypothetical protein